MSIAIPKVQIPLRRIARILAVMAIAMAAGHLVQTLAARRVTHVADAGKILPVKIVQLSSSSDDAQQIVPLTATGPGELARNLPVQGQDALPKPVQPVSGAMTCNAQLGLHAAPGGLVALSLLAPCHSNERVVLRQADLAVTAKVDKDGALDAELPLLSADGSVEIRFADGSKTSAQMPVAAETLARRFVVQWEGGADFILHGMENGADFNQTGDLTSANPGTPDAPQAGFVRVFGDDSVDNPLIAQVYSYPGDHSIRAEIVVEAAVNAGTCGHDLLGETIAATHGASVVTELTMAMPECTGIGDFLVLKNLASSEKIAAN